MQQSVGEAPMDMSVCVIIPYYNGSRYIERSARSVLEQSIPPAEFIVVDDGSSPAEAQALDEIAARMGFRVLHKENGGQGAARNFGVQQTRSNFISFLDQDDFYLKTHIEILLDGVKRKDPYFGWVYADLVEADEEGLVVRRETVVHRSEHPKKFLNDMLGKDMYVLPSASLIRREAYEAVGGFDPQFTGYEDDDLFLRIFQKGYTNYFVKKPVTVWCISNNSTSYSIKMSRSRLRYIHKLVQNFPDDPNKGRFFANDLFLPRFNRLVLGEAMRAIVPSGSPQDQKMVQYRDELIDIMNEYVKLMIANPFLSPRARKSLRLQAAVLNTRSRFIIRAAQFLKRRLKKSEE